MDDDAKGACCGLVLAAIFLFGVLGCDIYRASLQAEAYHRQNIQISTWEVLWGVQPAEKVIQIK